MENELHENRPVYSPVTLNQGASFQLFLYQDGYSDGINELYEFCHNENKKLVSCAESEVDIDQVLESELAPAPLGTMIYLAGTEAFMWNAANKLANKGLVSEQIEMLQPTSNQRNVFCVHCLTINQNVTESPATCSGCNRLLAVTDHFSKLHSAYLGYQVNAEDLTETFETQELT
jgi:hypothetical protein